MKRTRINLRDGVLIIFLVVLFVIMFYSYSTGGIIKNIVSSNTEGVSQFIASFGILSIFVFFILVILEVVIAPIPSVVLYAVGGAVFGTFIGGTTALAGNIIGALIDFKIAEKYGRRFVEGKVNGRRMEQFDRFSGRYGGWAIFLLRLNPFTSSDLVSYLAGLSKISMTQLLVGTGLGLLPLTYLQAYFGESVLFHSSLLTLIFILISLAYVAAFFYGIKRVRK
jgi:uncharacterized membrane protein YdjX (TVP38/TMEM64 family)